MKSELLDALYTKYDIANLTFGKIHDKLGDVYEELCVKILSNPTYLQLVQKDASADCLDIALFKAILESCSIKNHNAIQEISATNIVPHRTTHGLSKTDVIMTIRFVDDTEKRVAISCKQSYVSKIAFAEFDVDTICREVGITDERLKWLLLKHQTDKSAIFFSDEEKAELRKLIAPIREKFVRWVITGSPDSNPIDLVYPTVLVKFKLKKPKNRYDIHVDRGELLLQSFNVMAVEDFIHSVIYTKTGNVRYGGFGTGLSWTYATGSAGRKIQFKA